MKYTHTQKVPDKIMAIAGVAGLALGLTPPGMLMRLAVLGILGATAVAMRSLTVEVDDSEIRLSFGPGLFKKTFPLRQVKMAQATRMQPLSGWGVHWLGTGWLYNIYGLDAVEVIFSDGKRAYIGSDEPEKLATAINQSISPRLLTTAEQDG